MIKRRIELQTCKKEKKKLLVMFEFREQGEPDPHTIGFRRSRVPNGGVRLVRCPR